MNPSPAARRDWTVLEVLTWTTQRFADRGMTSPRLDAELLIAHALDIPRIGVYTRAADLLDATALHKIRDVVRRRQTGEPVAYITGRREFWGLDLQVNQNVLVPRPDTETVVEEALERFPDRPGRILDVGTGSGALAIVLSRVRPQAQVFACDISAASLDVARGNAERLGAPVTFLHGDLLAPTAGLEAFDLIVANLPYIPTGDLDGLSPEVQQEPRDALDGGADGLDLVRRLIADASGRLTPGGTLILEIGAGQADETRHLLVQTGYDDVHTRQDLGGIDRVVSGRRAGGSLNTENT